MCGSLFIVSIHLHVVQMYYSFSNGKIRSVQESFKTSSYSARLGQMDQASQGGRQDIGRAQTFSVQIETLTCIISSF